MNKKLKIIKASKKLHFIIMHAHFQCVEILSLAIRAKSVHKNKISKTLYNENKVHIPLHVKYDVFQSSKQPLTLINFACFQIM
jgi:hypothetical protein